MQPDHVEALAVEVALSIKSALAPLQLQLAVQALQIADLQRRVQDDSVGKELGALHERVAVIDARPPAAPDPAVADLRDQIKSLDSRLTAVTPEITALLVKTAVLETRAPVPGPAGADGTNGEAGTNGKDGLGFDDLSVEFDGERTLSLTFVKGAETKSFPIVLPFQRYLGVYQDGKQYQTGDVVTWGGSTWTATEATTAKPGEYAGAKAWTLCVKKGRDGRDGHDAPGAIPVVSVGRAAK